MPPRISVVVCARNEERMLPACLRALRAQKVRPWEIIMVDGWSSDQTADVAKKFGARVVLDEGRGISNARNVGWKTARGEVIAYCDADARPLPDWTANILRHIPGHWGISGPLTTYDTSTRARLTLKVWTDWFSRLTHTLGRTLFNGSNMAFTREALRAVPFREHVRILEDFDIGDRMRRAGRVGYITDMIMPVSARRYGRGFYHRTGLLYLQSWLRLRAGRPVRAEDYWN